MQNDMENAKHNFEPAITVWDTRFISWFIQFS